MTRFAALAGVAALAGLATGAHADTYRLANGLEVVLAPDASVGSVVVHIRYGAGSDDGPAQLIERLLAGGSPHVERGRFAHTLDTLGGWDNTATATDHTSVYEQLPPNALPLALFVEADRMAGTGEAIVTAALDHGVAAPGRAEIAAALHGALWPQPARTPPSVDAVRALWRDGYQPARAVLVIAGAFDPKEARRLIERDFGWIASAQRSTTPATPSATAPTPLAASSTLEIAGLTTPRVIVAARTDVPLSPAALDLEIAGRILAGGRSSRLYRRLVMTDQVATDVELTIAPRRGGGELAVSADARDRATMPAIATAITDEIAALADRGITAAELARAKTHAISELVTALEDLSFRADLLAAWTAYGVADLGAVRARIEAVTAASVQQSAKVWLAHVVTATVSP